MTKKPTFYAKGNTIYQSPQDISNVEADGKTTITTKVGFPICTVSEYVQVEDLLAMLLSIALQEQNYQKLQVRINNALLYLYGLVDGDSPMDSEISTVINILKGSPYALKTA